MIPITKLKVGENPRKITKQKLDALAASIANFPEMMELRPIVVGEDWKVLGGSMRLRALKQLGYTELPEAWVKQAGELTEPQKREFVLKDNSHFGTWDSDLLKGWGTQAELEGWGVELDGGAPAEGEASLKPAEFKPYTTVHVMLSFDAGKAPEVLPMLESVFNLDFVSYAQSAN